MTSKKSETSGRGCAASSSLPSRIGDYASDDMRREIMVALDQSGDEMTGINAEEKRSIPDAPAFDPCSLSAPSTTGIIRDSNCVDMSDHAVTQKQETPLRIRNANCKYPPVPTTLAEEEKIVFGFNRNDIKDLDPPADAQLLIRVGTAGSGKDAVGISRHDERGIAKQYFINTLCNALCVDKTQFLVGPYDSIPTITRHALSAKQHRLIGAPVAGLADLAYLKAKMADELRIDPVAVEILHKKHKELRVFFAAMLRYADDNARESHVRNINGLLMKARTPEEVEKNLTSAWGFDSERVLRDAGEEVKVADSVATPDDSIRVTPDNAPDDRSRHVRFGKWPTGEDVDQLPDLEDCLRSPSRVSHDIFDFEDDESSRDKALGRFGKCPSNQGRSHVFHAEPAVSSTDALRFGFDEAAKDLAKYCGARADDWKRQIMSPEFGVPNVTLNDFAAQIGKALRVLPFPPKEVTLSMTLKA